MAHSSNAFNDPDSIAYLDKQLGAMKTERSTFIDQYRDLSNFVQPRKGRFFVQDRNKGDRRWSNIINSVATQSLRSSVAGLFSGVASPSRPWFATETLDHELMEFGPVKIFLNELDNLFRNILNRSNFYNMTPVMMSELILFGTGAMSHVDDFENVARFYTHTVGSYMIAQNEKYEIDTFAREIQMTTHQMVSRFGLDKVSIRVQDAWNKGDYHTWFNVSQLIEPNKKTDDSLFESKFKKFRSVYWEPGNVHGKKLSEKGFDEFPVYVPRWSVTAEDIYGTDCPAMTALGDIKGLQIEERRKAQAVDKMVSPPLHGPVAVRTVPVQSFPFNGRGTVREIQHRSYG